MNAQKERGVGARTSARVAGSDADMVVKPKDGLTLEDEVVKRSIGHFKKLPLGELMNAGFTREDLKILTDPGRLESMVRALVREVRQDCEAMIDAKLKARA